MRNYSGWIIAGVICLILITLAVTGIVQFNNTPATSVPASSQAAFVRAFDGGARLMQKAASVPFRMVA